MIDKNVITPIKIKNAKINARKLLTKENIKIVTLKIVIKRNVFGSKEYDKKSKYIQILRKI